MTEHPAPAATSPLGSLPTEVIQELAAVGAAVGSNCELCLTFHHDKARRMGLTHGAGQGVEQGTTRLTAGLSVT